MPQTKEWFDAWFDSPYYHVLYKHRDDKEAKSFIDQLIAHFQFSTRDRIQDLACGKGRHTIYLNQKGFHVVGLDLSEQNIAYASQFENERLQFHVHDMRLPWVGKKFDFILNFFTSFGYFETTGENQQAITSIATALKPGGKLLIDFLNPSDVINNLVPKEIKRINGIDFNLQKSIQGEYIVKDIRFEHLGEQYEFQEKVKAISRMKFMKYFEHAGLELIELFGDYSLNPYIAEKSERMIFVLRK